MSAYVIRIRMQTLRVGTRGCVGGVVIKRMDGHGWSLSLLVVLSCACKPCESSDKTSESLVNLLLLHQRHLDKVKSSGPNSACKFEGRGN